MDSTKQGQAQVSIIIPTYNEAENIVEEHATAGAEVTLQSVLRLASSV